MGWLDDYTRIPFAGIVAMVLIVAVVAIFVKTELEPLFPQSQVKVQSGTDIAGMATSGSFYGLRDVALDKKEYLQGKLNTRTDAYTFTVDVPSRTLTIQHNGQTEEVELQAQDNLLVANFEYLSTQTAVRIDPAARILTLSYPGKATLSIDITLGDLVAYQGTFLFKGRQYLFQYFAGTSQAQIIGDRIDTLSLTPGGTGVWNDGTVKRPVTLDLGKMKATIEEVY